MMADRQTTGGYPKIATVISADLRVLAQRRPGDPVRFEAVGIEAAQRLARERAAEIAALPAALDAAAAVAAARGAPRPQPCGRRGRCALGRFVIRSVSRVVRSPPMTQDSRLGFCCKFIPETGDAEEARRMNIVAVTMAYLERLGPQAAFDKLAAVVAHNLAAVRRQIEHVANRPRIERLHRLVEPDPAGLHAPGGAGRSTRIPTSATSSSEPRGDGRDRPPAGRAAQHASGPVLRHRLGERSGVAERDRGIRVPCRDHEPARLRLPDGIRTARTSTSMAARGRSAPRVCGRASRTSRRPRGT